VTFFRLKEVFQVLGELQLDAIPTAELGNDVQLLDLLYEQNLIGDGVGEVNANANVDVDDNGGGEEEEDRGYEENMLFDGGDYNVDFHRFINVRRQGGLVFAGGVARETVYRVRFNADWAGVSLREIVGGLERVFESIIYRLNQSYNDHDLVRFFIQNDSFYTPHSLGLMPLHQVNVLSLLALIENLLQSDEDLFLDRPLEIHVGVIRNPLGGNRPDGVNSTEDLSLKKCVVKISNDDNLCLARSIVVALARAKLAAVSPDDENSVKRALNKYKHVINPARQLQSREAARLQLDAGLALDAVPAFTDIQAFERVVNARIIVFGMGYGVRPLYAGNEDGQHTLYLVYVVDPLKPRAVGHFHPIVKIHAFFGSSGFCERCLKPYDKRFGHRGCDMCSSCKSNECVSVESEKHVCSKCNRFMQSIDCNERHLQNGVCSASHRCKSCNTYYRPSTEHNCGSRECTVCKKMVTGLHFCYIRQQKPKQVSSKYIFADFEADASDIVHVPNLVIAHWQCEHCVDTVYRDNPHCEHCGSPCDKCRHVVSSTALRGSEGRTVCMDEELGCGRRGVSFFGESAATEFCEFVFRTQFHGYTLLFHNGQAYDAYFLAKYIFCTMKKLPKLIYRGSKIVSINVGKFRVIDSLNFLTFPLSQMPKVFGLKGLKKGTFPFFFNQPANWNYKGPLPEPHYYGVDTMKPKAREEFMKWYEENRENEFDFMKEIFDYCEDDVNILQESCNAFRSWLLGITAREDVIDVGEGGERVTSTVAVDPLQYNTLASVCMATYRHMFLVEKYSVELEDGRKVTGLLQNERWQLFDADGKELNQSEVVVKHSEFESTPFARMPSCGFGGLDAHSRASIVWLEYEAQRTGMAIQHAHNGVEHRVRNIKGNGWFKLDGYHKDPVTGREYAWEFYGCVYHGCRHCYGDGRKTSTQFRHPHTGESLRTLSIRTSERLAYLRQELKMEVRTMWECRFNALLELNENLQRINASCEILPRLDPRDAFYGGRTNAVRLYHEASGSKKIGYVDICSLYPMVLKNDVFPVGIPEVIMAPDSTDIEQYFGLVKARVRPPRGLYHPCLPVRIDGKLFFPLCVRCAHNLSREPCSCADPERDLVGTWTTIDLQDALRVGYVVIKVYEVYHFKETAKFDKTQSTPGLFSSYVDLFLKGKQEASGWPKQDMTEDEKAEYIAQYESVEGIRLDPENIEYNAGKRATNKLLLNSFWGKFGEANCHRAHVLAECEADILKTITDPTIRLKDMKILSDNRCMLEYVHSEGFLPEMSHVNVFVAAFTTANARSRLFHVLHKLGRRVLYFDTDSVVYEYDESNPQQYKPDMGDHLGQWTDELKEGQFIQRFVSSGPKSYSYVTNDGEKTTKLKGFTLNHETAKHLNFDSICDLVLFWADPDNHPLPDSYNSDPRVEVAYNKICRDKHKFKLFNRSEIKKFRVTYCKRRLIKGTFDTEPYGF